MPTANGVNYTIELDESVIANIMADVPLPERPDRIGNWSEFGRSVATRLRRLSCDPEVTVDDLFNAGQHYVPVPFADGWLRQNTKGRIGLNQTRPGSAPRVVGTSEVWQELIRQFLGRSIGTTRDSQSGTVVLVGVLELKRYADTAREVMTDRRRMMHLLKTVRARETAEENAPPVPAKSQSQRQDDMIRHIRNHEVQIVEAPLKTLEILPHGTRASRTWGIEVEHPAAYGVEAPDGWRQVRDGSLSSESADHDEECEAIRVDEESCTCGYSYDSFCKEFVSPVLTSVHSRGLEYLMERLGTRPFNSSAGLHVHVDARSEDGRFITPRQVASLVYGYNLLERLWEADYDRDSSARRSYSQSYRPDFIFNMAHQAKEMTRSRDAAHNIQRPHNLRTPGRYYNVNLQALNKHNTIEFRAMGPRYNYEHLIRWAMFCREMVNVAQSGFKDWARVHSFKDLTKVFSTYGRETAALSTFNEDELAAFIQQNNLVGVGRGEQ